MALVLLLVQWEHLYPLMSTVSPTSASLRVSIHAGFDGHFGPHGRMRAPVFFVLVFEFSSDEHIPKDGIGAAFGTVGASVPSDEHCEAEKCAPPFLRVSTVTFARTGTCELPSEAE